MKKNIFLIVCFGFIFFLGFITNIILVKINKSKEPIFLKWGYNEDGNIGWYSFDDRNGLIIIGDYNSEGLETLNIYDKKKGYNQSTSFGKTYDGPIEGTNPPEADEIIEIDSFLTRTEVINNHELKYYIDNSRNPKIFMESNLE